MRSLNRPLFIVMLGAFAAQTTEYLPIGLLPQVGRGLGVSDSDVGMLVTGYAWLAAVTAIPMTLATKRMNRRTLFLRLLAVIAIANLLAALSHGYAMLAAMRIVTALTHGVFWSVLASFATRLAPEMPPRRALAWAFGGISLAVVAGVPLATAIGQAAGWRMAFGVFGILAACLSLVGARGLPSVASQHRDSNSELPRGNAPLYGAALVTALIIAAHFCAYTYIVSLLLNVAVVPDAHVPLFLFVFGMAGAVGTGMSGWLGVKPAAMALTAALCLVGNQALMMLAARVPGVAWLNMIVWGSAISMLIVGLQGWVLELAPHQADSASALYVAAFNTGIGGGAWIGGIALAAGGDRFVLPVGVMLGLIACLCFSLPSIVGRRTSAKLAGIEPRRIESVNRPSPPE
ncbi:MFS transporter [Pararobbsia silviterrae]|uniref:MFS transporter n=1 Tax=Pararobbsia silviterrae TaxID=1792498 RepID=A0A494XFY6_9BURK|nr:MFS transporter [Pararobbsia silviterrae]RKP49665.1 MFS transporter [Pararobbsia silviterrae]